MSRSTIPAALAWLAAALFAVGSWLCLPRARGAAGPPVHALLVDLSASACGARGPDAHALGAVLEERRAAAAASGAEPLGIAFGEGARRFDVAAGLRPPDLARGEDRSDLAAALGLCLDPARSGRLRSVEVLGDGTWTGVDPAGVAARLAALGVRIAVVPTAARTGHDAHVAPIAGPIRVRRGEPVRVPVTVWRWIGAASGGALPAQLVVTAALTEDGRTEERAVRLAAEPSDHGPRAVRVEFEFPAPERGRALLDVRAELVDRDGRRVSATPAADSTARAELLAEGSIAIAVLGDDVAARAFERALGEARPDIAVRDIHGVLGGELDAADVLATVDVAFDREAAAAVDAFVAAGGGWIDLAVRSLALGSRPRAAALIPAAPDGRPREITVLVDASGSMAGDPARAARAALALLVDAARPEDGLGARWFAADADVALDLGRPGERADAARRRRALESVAAAPEPRGPTRIWGAVEDAAARVDARARTLVILVSDGRDPERADLAPRAARLRADLARSGAELAVIAVGADPDRELLAALAGGASAVLEAGDLAGVGAADRLARLLESALASGSIVEDPDARPAAYAGAGRELAAPFADLAAPAVRSFARARAADGATVVWTSAAGGTTTPLLAFARRGSGVAAGLDFLPDASSLRAANDLGGALATAVRAVAPPGGRARPRLVERAGELVLEGVADGAPAVVRAELRTARGAHLGGVDLYAARVQHDPVRERSAEMPAALADLAAGEAVVARIAALGSGDEPLELVFAAPRAPETARVPAAFVPPDPAPPDPRLGAPGPHPAGSWTVVAGLAALAAAVGAGLFSRSRP